MTPPDRPSRPRRWPRRLLRGVLLLLAVLALAELVLRWMLFGADPVARRLGAPVRHEARFAGPREDAYWKLRVVLAGRDRVEPHEFADRELGWISRRLEPGTLAHRATASVGERRPLLIYGDSFAHCKLPAEQCWEGLVEDSLLGREWRVLNHGVEGYGLDQTVMLLLDTIDAWADRDPFVIVSLLLDDDLDRSMLRFRGWAKPWFEPTPDGDLVRHAVPEGDLDPDVAARPVGIASYLWRLFRGSTLFPAAWREALLESEAELEPVRERNRRILALAHTELEARGIEHAFLLFHGSRLLSVRDDWREALVLETLRGLGADWTSTRSSFDSHRMRFEHTVEDYFLPEGPGVGHYDPLGNVVAFDAVRRALAGMFDGDLLLADFADVRQTNLPEERRAELYRTGPGPLLETPLDHWRLVIPAEGEAPTSVRYAVRGPAARLTGEVRVDPSSEGPVLFVVRQEEEILLRRVLRPADGRVPLDLVLDDPETVAFSAKAARGEGRVGVVVSAPWVHGR